MAQLVTTATGIIEASFNANHGCLAHIGSSCRPKSNTHSLPPRGNFKPNNQCPRLSFRWSGCNVATFTISLELSRSILLVSLRSGDYGRPAFIQRSHHSNEPDVRIHWL
jgi:hypothetical protein